MEDLLELIKLLLKNLVDLVVVEEVVSVVAVVVEEVDLVVAVVAEVVVSEPVMKEKEILLHLKELKKNSEMNYY